MTSSFHGCARQSFDGVERTVLFGGEAVAVVRERVGPARDGIRAVERGVRLTSGETIEVRAQIDETGIVRDASYRRSDKRSLRFTDGVITDTATGARTRAPLPVVLVDLVHLVHLARPEHPMPVTLLDLSSAELLEVTLALDQGNVVARDRHGAVVVSAAAAGKRTGPGVFGEGDASPFVSAGPAPVFLPVSVPAPDPMPVVTAASAFRLVGVDDVIPFMQLDGDGQRASGFGVVTMSVASPLAQAPGQIVGQGPSPRPSAEPERAPPRGVDAAVEMFIEHDAVEVRAFAAQHAMGRDVLNDAWAIASAVYPLVDPARTAEPPSAVRMLRAGGDCDGAAALVVAALRAAGHSARAVVGYRRVRESYAPHAWAEVLTPDGWLLVDATIPQLGPRDGIHLKLFEGLGGALTMGRVLGRLRLEAFTL